MNIETINELIQSLESAGELSIREQKFLKLAKAYKQLAAENVGLKTKANEVLREAAYVYSHYNRMVEHLDGESVDGQTLHELQTLLSETLATDAYLAGIKADGRVEGINFAASRLAAAFNHGFVDKPMTEVGDMVRMILDAKADLANSPIPPEDGLSGEYAEKSLAEWEATLREGADKC
ncbi:hypothetical protein M5R35_20830 [Klebsiella michiganensis]|uniref:hypothetical protein n=1 Tax=Klebsiella michiganensis TaxID=1134687 RepID=UPI002175B675|nr:hypothetical protein [Klebsiella michiganensis]UVZ84475.1 hypothetical protein M5R35_20830 [Klebsiella michiganensis]